LLKNINFKRPRYGDLPQENLVVERKKNYGIKNFHSGIVTIKNDDLKSLNAIMPNAAFFTSVKLSEDNDDSMSIPSQTDTMDESEVNCIPEPLTSLYESTAINIDCEEKLNDLCHKIYFGYKSSYSEESYINLTNITKAQSLSNSWKLHRGGRITASNFYEVCHKNLEYVLL